MACKVITTGPNSMAIVCTSGRRADPCSVPGCGRPHEVLCDYPLAPLEFGQEPKM